MSLRALMRQKKLPVMIWVVETGITQDIKLLVITIAFSAIGIIAAGSHPMQEFAGSNANSSLINYNK